MPISDLNLNILAALTIKHRFGGCYDNDQKEAVRDFYLQYAAAHAFKPDIVRVPEVFPVNLDAYPPEQLENVIKDYIVDSHRHSSWYSSNACRICCELLPLYRPTPTVEDYIIKPLERQRGIV